MPWSTRGRRFAAAAVLIVLAAGLAGWLLWPEDAPPPPRERHYKATTACLLTDEAGLDGTTAKAAWAGMQEASTATLIKVQYLAITGPQTAANGLSFYNTLGVQQCTVIIAAGPAPVAAMLEGHARFAAVKQVAIGADTGAAPITKVDAASPATIQAGVRGIVAAA